MKKLIPFLCLILLCTSCKKQQQETIETIIKQTGSTIIAINYPITGNSKLDKIISKNINDTYQKFEQDFKIDENDEQSELNIDYTYETINNHYDNITITTYISSHKMAHPSTEINTYVYDRIQDKIITLKDIVDEKNIQIIKEKTKQILQEQYENCLIETLDKNTTELYSLFSQFTIDTENLTIYFNPYIITSGVCGIIKIQIPLKDLELLITIEKDIYEENAVFKTQTTNQILNPNQKVVALTFDDGPTNYTNEIIEYLKQEDVNATFFILGNKVNNYKDTLRKLVQYGNELGNHSYNHKLLIKLSIEEIKNQIESTNELITNVTGFTPTLLRPTYGAVNNKIKQNTDMEITLWTVDTLDWKTKNYKKIAENTLKKVNDLDIILMHDTKKRTLEALKIIIPKLKEEGYQIVTVSELNEIKKLRKNNP